MKMCPFSISPSTWHVCRKSRQHPVFQHARNTLVINVPTRVWNRPWHVSLKVEVQRLCLVVDGQPPGPSIYNKHLDNQQSQVREGSHAGDWTVAWVLQQSFCKSFLRYKLIRWSMKIPWTLCGVEQRDSTFQNSLWMDVSLNEWQQSHDGQ